MEFRIRVGSDDASKKFGVAPIDWLNDYKLDSRAEVRILFCEDDYVETVKSEENGNV